MLGGQKEPAFLCGYCLSNPCGWCTPAHTAKRFCCLWGQAAANEDVQVTVSVTHVCCCCCCCCCCRLNAMNEIWVPSAWQAESFAASGVARDKLVVVPEVGRKGGGRARRGLAGHPTSR
jgi:hypothetical protein